MAKPIREGKLLYHVTAIENLESILRHVLLSREDIMSKGLKMADIADPSIIEKRKEMGILQFIPFHFFEPTAFTGTVYNSHPDKKFCCITISRDYAQQKNFKICTAHPLSQDPEALVYDYDEGFNKINWKEAEKRDYDNPVSKTSCMAECLAISPVYPNVFRTIFVANDETKKTVDEIIMNVYGKKRISVMVNSFIVKA